VADSFWKDVVALARPSLSFRRGRYYYSALVSARVRQEQEHQEGIQTAIRQLITQHRADAERVERREQDRITFVQPVKVRTEDAREFTLLSRDLSPTGIRLIGTSRLLGQKVWIELPRTDQPRPWTFLVRVLWTCAVGDGLFENGGTFVEVSPG
jgi:hypothetical protein